MESIIKDKEKLVEMGRKSFALVKELYSPEAYISGISKILND
jgi:hypothetical protein